MIPWSSLLASLIVRRFARSLLVLLMLTPWPRFAEARRIPARPRPSVHPQFFGPPEVLFTFDDGPHLQNTPKVLGELAEHGIKAIFFVNGWHFDRDPRARALLKQELDQGHYVGNHTYSHRILCKHLKDAPTEIDRNEDLLEQVLGFRPTLLRTPYGQHCRKLREIVDQRGYRQIGWDIDPQEWRGGKKADQVARFIITRLSRLRGRAIVLMHDTHSATVQALPKVLDWLAKHPEIKVVDWHVLLGAHAPGAPRTVVAQPAQPTSALLRALEWMRSRIAAATCSLPWPGPSPGPLAAARKLML